MERSQELLKLAEDTAREAGALLQEGAKQLRQVNFSDDRDVKLQGDVESEQLIRKRLADTQLPVIGEEIGGDESLIDAYNPYWVVDPLDGTHNYLRHVPMTCVSIGLMRGETPVLGVIYDFNRDEMFSAQVTEGLFINGEAIRPKWADSVDQASLQTGFPTAYEFSDDRLQAAFGRVKQFKKVRMIGSAALAMAWVACGRFDAYYEETIRLWDIAAGLALVQAAGGVVRMSKSHIKKPLAYDVWAAGKPMFIIE